VVAQVRERLAVNKQRSHRFHMENFNLKKLKEIDCKEQYCFEVSNRFAALEDLGTEVDINSALERIGENLKISAKESLGYYKLKKRKSWFGRGCSELLDQKKGGKVQWLQASRKINRDNLNSVKCEEGSTVQYSHRVLGTHESS
jgi:hypothetical protein